MNKMTTVNQIKQWLEKLNHIYLKNENFELNIATRENQIDNQWRPVGYVYEHRGLQHSLNAYKKKLVQLEKEVIRTFRFPKSLEQTFTDFWKKNGSRRNRENMRIIYLEGRNDMRIAYKHGEWRLHNFGFGWMYEASIGSGNYLSRNGYDVDVQYSMHDGWKYNNTIDRLENSKEMLRESLLFLKDILLKPHNTNWSMT